MVDYHSVAKLMPQIALPAWPELDDGSSDIDLEAAIDTCMVSHNRNKVFNVLSAEPDLSWHIVCPSSMEQFLWFLSSPASAYELDIGPLDITVNVTAVILLSTIDALQATATFVSQLRKEIEDLPPVVVVLLLESDVYNPDHVKARLEELLNMGATQAIVYVGDGGGLKEEIKAKLAKTHK